MSDAFPIALVGAATLVGALAYWYTRSPVAPMPVWAPGTAAPAPSRIVPQAPTSYAPPSDEAGRWASLDPNFAARVRAVFADLTAQGFQPRLASAWRSASDQARKLAAGSSQVSVSYHMNVGPRGEPASLAGDVVDRRWGWTVGSDAARFFTALRSSAARHGLDSGANWSKRAPWATYGLGWDPAHLQARGTSLAAVGARLASTRGVA